MMPKAKPVTKYSNDTKKMLDDLKKNEQPHRSLHSSGDDEGPGGVSGNRNQKLSRKKQAA